MFDWDSNHTGLEARGCVALGIVNNSRRSIVVNTRLNDGAEIRVMPLGRRQLMSSVESVEDASSSGGAFQLGRNEWRSERSLVVFAWGYTPTLFTTGDVYFTVQSNACNVFVTRKTARLKANLGYSATFTHQEQQSWSSTNIVIIGDDIQGHPFHRSSSSNSMSGESSYHHQQQPQQRQPQQQLPLPSPSRSSPNVLVPTVDSLPVSGRGSNGPVSDGTYLVTFRGQALGLVAEQRGRSVVVRECLPASAALASGKIGAGDEILTVNGHEIHNTRHFGELVTQSSRPVVVGFRRVAVDESYDLFGEAETTTSVSSSTGGAVAVEDVEDYRLFG